MEKVKSEHIAQQFTVRISVCDTIRAPGGSDLRPLDPDQQEFVDK